MSSNNLNAPRDGQARSASINAWNQWSAPQGRVSDEDASFFKSLSQEKLGSKPAFAQLSAAKSTSNPMHHSSRKHRKHKKTKQNIDVSVLPQLPARPSPKLDNVADSDAGKNKRTKTRRRLICCAICMISFVFIVSLSAGLIAFRTPTFEPDLNSLSIDGVQLSLAQASLNAQLGFNISFTNDNFGQVNVLDLKTNLTFGDIILDIISAEEGGIVNLPPRNDNFSSPTQAILNLTLAQFASVFDLLQVCLFGDGVANFTLNSAPVGEYLGIQDELDFPPEEFFLPCSLSDLGIDFSDIFGIVQKSGISFRAKEGADGHYGYMDILQVGNVVTPGELFYAFWSFTKHYDYINNVTRI